MRARRIDSVSAARTAGSSASSASASAAAGTRGSGDVDAVEAQRGLADGRVAARRDVLDERGHRRQRRMHVDLRARQDAAQVGGAGGREVETA